LTPSSPILFPTILFATSGFLTILAIAGGGRPTSALEGTA